MSQNFQLLSEIELELRLPTAIRNPDSRATACSEEKQQTLFSQELIGLAQSIFMAKDGESPHQVVFCGVDRESVSSELCRDLGNVLGFYSEQPVCLLDAGVDSLRLSRLLNVASPHPGNCQEVAPHIWCTSANLSEAGQERPLNSVNRWKERLTDLHRSFEYILIDAPGMNTRGDAEIICSAVGAAVLVIEANATRKAAALRAKQSLTTGSVKLLGSVLYNRTFPIPDRLYQKL